MSYTEAYNKIQDKYYAGLITSAERFNKQGQLDNIRFGYEGNSPYNRERMAFIAGEA